MSLSAKRGAPSSHHTEAFGSLACKFCKLWVSCNNYALSEDASSQDDSPPGTVAASPTPPPSAAPSSSSTNEPQPAGASVDDTPAKKKRRSELEDLLDTPLFKVSTPSQNDNIFCAACGRRNIWLCYTGDCNGTEVTVSNRSKHYAAGKHKMEDPKNIVYTLVDPKEDQKNALQLLAASPAQVAAPVRPRDTDEDPGSASDGGAGDEADLRAEHAPLRRSSSNTTETRKANGNNPNPTSKSSKGKARATSAKKTKGRRGYDSEDGDASNDFAHILHSLAFSASSIPVGGSGGGGGARESPGTSHPRKEASRSKNSSQERSSRGGSNSSGSRLGNATGMSRRAHDEPLRFENELPDMVTRMMSGLTTPKSRANAPSSVHRSGSAPSISASAHLSQYTANLSLSTSSPSMSMTDALRSSSSSPGVAWSSLPAVNHVPIIASSSSSTSSSSPSSTTSLSSSSSSIPAQVTPDASPHPHPSSWVAPSPISVSTTPVASISVVAPHVVSPPSEAWSPVTRNALDAALVVSIFDPNVSADHMETLITQLRANPNVTIPGWPAHMATPLHAAIYVQDLFKIQRLCQLGAHPNGSEDMKAEVAPLHACVGRSKSATMIEFLCAHGARPNVVDWEGYTPLHRAVEQVDMAAMSALLAYNGTNVNAVHPLTHFTSLHTAVSMLPFACDRPEQGSKEAASESVVAALLAHSHINTRAGCKTRGQTALHIAAARGIPHLVAAIIERDLASKPVTVTLMPSAFPVSVSLSSPATTSSASPTAPHPSHADSSASTSSEGTSHDVDPYRSVLPFVNMEDSMGWTPLEHASVRYLQLTMTDPTLLPARLATSAQTQTPSHVHGEVSAGGDVLILDDDTNMENAEPKGDAEDGEMPTETSAASQDVNGDGDAPMPNDASKRLSVSVGMGMMDINASSSSPSPSPSDEGREERAALAVALVKTILVLLKYGAQHSKAPSVSSVASIVPEVAVHVPALIGGPNMQDGLHIKDMYFSSAFPYPTGVDRFTSSKPKKGARGSNRLSRSGSILELPTGQMSGDAGGSSSSSSSSTSTDISLTPGANMGDVSFMYVGDGMYDNDMESDEEGDGEGGEGSGRRAKGLGANGMAAMKKKESLAEQFRNAMLKLKTSMDKKYPYLHGIFTSTYRQLPRPNNSRARHPLTETLRQYCLCMALNGYQEFKDLLNKFYPHCYDNAVAKGITAESIGLTGAVGPTGFKPRMGPQLPGSQSPTLSTTPAMITLTPPSSSSGNTPPPPTINLSFTSTFTLPTSTPTMTLSQPLPNTTAHMQTHFPLSSIPLPVPENSSSLATSHAPLPIPTPAPEHVSPPPVPQPTPTPTGSLAPKTIIRLVVPYQELTSS
eukprot:TRINITY_DN4364_c0_g1_i3.p1 TRINITY_DN4364_c0_g1~~TRINITY_DN4364_c0_g1_i3.p1  ORF type:complete len:1359 (-),score=382.87 TRINITY_DN4364_c0_g1_i3:1-4077(-)